MLYITTGNVEYDWILIIGASAVLNSGLIDSGKQCDPCLCISFFVFFLMECLCEEDGWERERLHLSLDYLRKLVFFSFWSQNWCSDLDSITAAQPNIWILVIFGEQQ